MDNDYNTFSDRVLIALADEQEPPGLNAIEIRSLCERNKIYYQETWLDLICRDLEGRGFGECIETVNGSKSFLINGEGLRKATELRKHKFKKEKIDLDKLYKIATIIIALVVAAAFLFGYGVYA